MNDDNVGNRSEPPIFRPPFLALASVFFTNKDVFYTHGLNWSVSLDYMIYIQHEIIVNVMKFI